MLNISQSHNPQHEPVAQHFWRVNWKCTIPVPGHCLSLLNSLRAAFFSVGKRGAQPNAGLNVTRTVYIVRQDQAGRLSAIFLLLPEDGLPRICGKFWLYFVKILDKESFDTMKVFFFIIGFFRFLSWVYTFPNLILYCLNFCWLKHSTVLKHVSYS